MSQQTLAVETHGLKKRYGKREVLHGIDLSIDAATVFGVVGPNGAGKTTTMRILLDIIRPSSGRVAVLGQSPKAGGATLRQRIGYLPGELRLPSRSSARTLLSYYAQISGPVPHGRIEELAERLSLPLDQRIGTLSKGNKQKVGLVQAFMHRPALLVLDEPTSGLDPLVQQTFHSLVSEARAAGQTVFLSSHVLSEIQQTADQVTILRDGRILTVSTVAQLQETAHRTISARLKPENGRDTAAALRAVPGIANLAVRPSDNSTIEITATLSREIDAFVRTLTEKSRHIDDLVLQEPDLEQSVLALYNSPTTPTADDSVTADTGNRKHIDPESRVSGTKHERASR